MTEWNVIIMMWQDLQDEINRLIHDVESLRRRLEEECMEKIELQGHVKGQAEEFAVRTQIFEQEIVNIKKHREIEIEEMDNRLQKVIRQVEYKYCMASFFFKKKCSFA